MTGFTLSQNLIDIAYIGDFTVFSSHDHSSGRSLGFKKQSISNAAIEISLSRISNIQRMVIKMAEARGNRTHQRDFVPLNAFEEREAHQLPLCLRIDRGVCEEFYRCFNHVILYGCRYLHLSYRRVSCVLHFITSLCFKSTSFIKYQVAVCAYRFHAESLQHPAAAH